MGCKPIPISLLPEALQQCALKRMWPLGWTDLPEAKEEPGVQPLRLTHK